MGFPGSWCGLVVFATGNGQDIPAAYPRPSRNQPGSPPTGQEQHGVDQAQVHRTGGHREQRQPPARPQVTTTSLRQGQRSTRVPDTTPNSGAGTWEATAPRPPDRYSPTRPGVALRPALPRLPDWWTTPDPSGRVPRRDHRTTTREHSPTRHDEHADRRGQRERRPIAVSAASPGAHEKRNTRNRLRREGPAAAINDAVNPRRGATPPSCPQRCYASVPPLSASTGGHNTGHGKPRKWCEYRNRIKNPVPAISQIRSRKRKLRAPGRRTGPKAGGSPCRHSRAPRSLTAPATPAAVVSSDTGAGASFPVRVVRVTGSPDEHPDDESDEQQYQ